MLGGGEVPDYAHWVMAYLMKKESKWTSYQNAMHEQRHGPCLRKFRGTVPYLPLACNLFQTSEGGKTKLRL